MKSYRRKDIALHEAKIPEVPQNWYSKITSEMINEYWPEQYIIDYFAEVLNGTTTLNEMRDNILSFIPEYEEHKFNISECDGGASVGGDAGGAIGDAGGAESGISSGDVLGSHDHSDYAGGFMGPGCFHMPSHVKTPLHRYELCNGGSKRKKTKSDKDKKYAYEKGMKVVVDMFEDEMLNEWGMSIEDLRGKPWESVKNLKNPPSYEKWEAAQLPDPEYDKHGELGGCEITTGDGNRPYMKEYYLHGHYEDGTMFEMGPMRSKVLREYINLHKISVNQKSWDQLEKQGFASIKQHDINGSKMEGIVDIIKLPDGFYLKSVYGGSRIGPFTSKYLARRYALANKYEFQTSGKKDKVDPELFIKYPTFLFTYKMMGIDCADIVVAETLEKAMKLFDFQWHVFDNTRPTKMSFKNINDLKQSLKLLRITDIGIEKLDATNANDLIELADEIGNPSTIPQLKSRCRNPLFRYILGRDAKTGRNPIVIRW